MQCWFSCSASIELELYWLLCLESAYHYLTYDGDKIQQESVVPFFIGKTDSYTLWERGNKRNIYSKCKARIKGGRGGCKILFDWKIETTSIAITWQLTLRLPSVPLSTYASMEGSMDRKNQEGQEGVITKWAAEEKGNHSATLDWREHKRLRGPGLSDEYSKVEVTEELRGKMVLENELGKKWEGKKRTRGHASVCQVARRQKKYPFSPSC